MSWHLPHVTCDLGPCQLGLLIVEPPKGGAEGAQLHFQLYDERQALDLVTSSCLQKQDPTRPSCLQINAGVFKVYTQIN
jgi:hypothetical protein